MPIATTNLEQRRSRWAWMWLAYIGFLFIQPILEPSRNVWLGTIAAFILFLINFWALFRCAVKESSTRLWLVAATFALGLVVFPWNRGASTFFIYAAAFLPFMIESLAPRRLSYPARVPRHPR